MNEIYNKVLTQIPNKILAVGKNYIDHVKEMGGIDFPKEPVIFQKPLTSLIHPNQSTFYLPKHGRPIHHEIELGIMISKTGKDIMLSEWKNYIGGYFLALDLTDRDLQAQFKKAGQPWDLSKGQDGFMPISEFIDVNNIKDFNNLELLLKINGEVRQNDSTEKMFYKIPFIIEYCSQFMTLCPGDLIITGTPSGVGPIKDGDYLEALLIEDKKIVIQRNLIIKQSMK